MSTIVAAFTTAGTPATGLAATLRIRRADTQALVVTDDAMVEQGDGLYSYGFAPLDGVDYVIRADGGATLDDVDRYQFGSLSGTAEARIETDIPAILDDTAVSLPADLTTLLGRTVDLDALIAFVIGGAIGDTSVHTPATVTAGGFTWSIGVAGSTITITRLT